MPDMTTISCSQSSYMPRTHS
ncbi:hypothetical protein ID866_8672 [Astraeus odoratus]|nr:hypothetical protein ID866_8672 [Astraeus odoratus]